MKKWKKNLIIIISSIVAIVLTTLFFWLAIKYDDTHKSNLIAVICCIISLISSIVIGVLALFQNSLYNSRENKKQNQRTENLLYAINKLVKQNETIIKTWKVEKNGVFEFTNEHTYFEMSPLKEWNNSIFSAIDIETHVFKLITDYNQSLCRMNVYIDNYNKATKLILSKEIETYKGFIVQELNQLKIVQDKLLTYFYNLNKPT